MSSPNAKPKKPWPTYFNPKEDKKVRAYLKKYYNNILKSEKDIRKRGKWGKDAKTNRDYHLRRFKILTDEYHILKKRPRSDRPHKKKKPAPTYNYYQV